VLINNVVVINLFWFLKFINCSLALISTFQKLSNTATFDRVHRDETASKLKDLINKLEADKVVLKKEIEFFAKKDSINMFNIQEIEKTKKPIFIIEEKINTKYEENITYITNLNGYEQLRLWTEATRK
jgi:hypothetical protein